jgi:hypothetical protein
VILLLSVPIGLVLGLAAGGGFSGPRELRLRGELILVSLLVLQGILPVVAAGGVARTVLYWVWALTFPVMAGICMANLRVPGMALAAVGLALNAIVILANSGMPVLPEAVMAAGGGVLAIPPTDFGHTMAGAATLLPVLADVLPIPGPVGIRGAASAGDVALACGIVVCLTASMLRAGRNRRSDHAGSPLGLQK